MVSLLKNGNGVQRLIRHRSKHCLLGLTGEDQAEVQLMSNMNADTKVPLHYTKALQAWLRKIAEDVMDQQVVKTDMKLRHILNKGIEVKRSLHWLNYDLLVLSFS